MDCDWIRKQHRKEKDFFLRKGDLGYGSYQYIYKHLKRRCKVDEARLFPGVISAGMRGNVHKLKTGALAQQLYCAGD